MFQSMFRRAETAIDSIVAKYTARVMVAVPLVVALGFVTAAVTVKFVELYGQAAGLSIMAGIFVVLTLLTMAVVGAGALGDSSPASEEGQTRGKAEQREQIASEAEGLLTPELRAVLSAAAPVAVPAVTRVATKNLHLIVLVAVIIYVFSRYGQLPSEEGKEAGSADAAGAMPPSA